jgi:hypothetical protein
MRTIEIAEVSIDENDRLLIYPRQLDDSFQYIYRAAAEVQWDRAQACFATPKPQGWSHLRWFQHACDAVRDELGCDLELNDRTTWTNFPDGLRLEIWSERYVAASSPVE